MVCVHYSVFAKKTGRLITKNFTWIDRGSDPEAVLRSIWNPRTCRVYIDYIAD